MSEETIQVHVDTKDLKDDGNGLYEIKVGLVGIKSFKLHTLEIPMLNYYISNKETWTSGKKFSEWKINVTQNFDFDVFCYGVLEDQICTLANRLSFLCPHSETLNYWRRKMESIITNKFEEMVRSRNNL
jgi:hypothetical protein